LAFKDLSPGWKSAADAALLKLDKLSEFYEGDMKVMYRAAFFHYGTPHTRLMSTRQYQDVKAKVLAELEASGSAGVVPTTSAVKPGGKFYELLDAPKEATMTPAKQLED
jgi:hypothetical protein